MTLFHEPWWLDAVAPGQWGVASVPHGEGDVHAALPYVKKSRFGFTLLTMPQLTNYLGPQLRPGEAKLPKRLGQEREWIDELVNQLPKHDYFAQPFHPSITNWLPFYWRGFRQTTKYTYVLDDLSDLDRVWAGMLENIRRDIRKAQRQLTVRSDGTLESLLDVNAKSFRRLGKELPYSRAAARRIEAACSERDCRRMFFVEDPAGLVHSTLYMVWDEGSAYYLMGGSDPELRSSGANSLAMWSGIEHAAKVTRRFDFEGSMIDAVERFVRAFGGRQTPYHYVTGMSRRMAAAAACQDLIGALRHRGHNAPTTRSQ